MKQIDVKDRYQKDKNFREYVDRFCKTYNRTVEETLSLALVQEVASYYAKIARFKLKSPHMRRWGSVYDKRGIDS